MNLLQNSGVWCVEKNIRSHLHESPTHVLPIQDTFEAFILLLVKVGEGVMLKVYTTAYYLLEVREVQLVQVRLSTIWLCNYYLFLGPHW